MCFFHPRCLSYGHIDRGELIIESIQNALGYDHMIDEELGRTVLEKMQAAQEYLSLSLSVGVWVCGCVGVWVCGGWGECVCLFLSFFLLFKLDFC